MKKKVLHITIFSLAMFIGSSTTSFASSLIFIDLNTKLSTDYGDKPNSKAFIENNKKKRNQKKPTVKIFNADRCPTFEAYYSKSKIKREKMLSRKAKRK